MAEKKVGKNDIVSDGLFDNLKASAKAAATEVAVLEKSMEALAKSAVKIQKSLNSNKAIDVKGLKEFNKLTKDAEKTANSKLKLDKQLNAARDEEVKARLRLQKVAADQRKSLNIEIDLENKQIGTLEKARITNKKLRNEREKLNLNTKKGNTRLKIINRTIDHNNKLIERNSDKMKKQRLSVGKYTNAIRGLQGGLARLGLGFGVFSLLKNSFSVIAGFQQGVANLRAVMADATEGEFKAMETAAKKLGATTKFTAAEVTGLQLEFGKLGFNPTEINNMTKATLNLAAATGEELAESASVVGGVMNAFGLESAKTGHVVNVMASSFSKSALDLNKFSETMKTSAPIARATGVSLELATAAAGKLADANISGSKAGTDLKNIFSALVKDGKPLTESLEDISTQLNNAGTRAERLAIAEDLVGEKAKASLLVLVEQKDSLKELATGFETVGEEAERMAKEQLKTLDGAITLLGSAWDGFILSMDEAGGIGEKLRGIIGFMAENLNEILGVLWLVIKAFVAFKVALVALKLRDKFKDLKAYNKSLKKSGEAATQAKSGIKGFGNALKSIGFGIAITLIAEFVAGLWDVVSGAMRARFELELLNKTLAKGAKNTQKFIDDNAKKLLLETNAIRARNLAQKEEDKLIKEATERANDRVKAAIDTTKTAKENTKDRIWNENVRLKQMEKEMTIIKRASGLYSDEIIAIEMQKNTIAKLEANLTAYDERIVTLTTNTESYTQEVFEQNLELNKNNNLNTEGNKILEKKISLIREITDETIKQVKSDEERGVLELQAAAGRRVKDIKDTVADENEKAKLIKLINDNLKTDIENLRQGFRDDEKAAEKKNAEDIAAIVKEAEDSEKAQIKEAEDKAKKEREEKLANEKRLIDLLTEYAIKKADERIAKIDDEITAAQKQSDFFAQLAAEGNITAKESLAEQNKLIAEANAQKEEEERRKQNILKISTFLNSYNANLAAGDSSSEAFAKASLDFALVNAFISDIPTFFEGIEDTGARGNGVDGRGGFHAVLHPNERVVPKEINDQLKGVSNEDLPNLLEQRRVGRYVESYTMDVGTDNKEMVDSLGSVIGKLDEVNKTIQNKEELKIDIVSIHKSAMLLRESKRKGNRITNSVIKIDQ